MNTSLIRRTLISAAIVAAISASGLQAGTQSHTAKHTFTLFDIVGDRQGTTYAYTDGPTTGTGNGGDSSILCGVPWVATSPDCDADHPPIDGDEASKLFPIDSDFGFEVVPFAKAVDKQRGDGVWGEGYAGLIVDGTNKPIGIELSDAETDTFVVPAGLGTWCTGLGGASVKCSTEHFVTMEHVLTCHETIPYYYADEDTGTQAEIEDPENLGSTAVYCADAKLDNNLIILNSESDLNGGDVSAINGKPVGTVKYDAVSGDPIYAVDWETAASWSDPDEVLQWFEPNESTVLDDIAFGSSYSITAKDDGKPLYRWGNLIKRPNDIRLYARFWLPPEWTSGGAWDKNSGNGYRVTKARLIINHKVTNNPNDQVRPEDMENEAAIGRQPGYDIVSTPQAGTFVSDTTCFQGNGIEIPQNTVLKNPKFAIQDTVPASHIWENNPYAWSEDLKEGYTNAWYTTVDREPFEWSYDTDGDGAADVSYREPLSEPLDTGTTLLSGPRWRLTPPKFGQDIPGLEIPIVNCAPPPYQKAMIKYDVGELASEDNLTGPGPTILDLLDWSGEDERSITDPDTNLPVSPLSFTNGWINGGWYNEGTVVNPGVTIVNPLLSNVTVNGAPITKQFDLSLYVKGDRKPTALYNARLEIEWDDGNP
jgi:hypothetical protein